eukprot:gene25323-biopygen18000
MPIFCPKSGYSLFCRRRPNCGTPNLGTDEEGNISMRLATARHSVEAPCVPAAHADNCPAVGTGCSSGWGVGRAAAGVRGGVCVPPLPRRGIGARKQAAQQSSERCSWMRGPPKN